jgi:hypothetical protein
LSIVFLGGAYGLAVDIDLLCACVCRKYCDIFKQSIKKLNINNYFSIHLELNDTMLNGKHVPRIYGIGKEQLRLLWIGRDTTT